MALTKQTITQHPKDDPSLQRLLKRMPENIAASFSTEQLIGLREAIGVRGGKVHSVDVRTTFQLPLLPFNYYMVFLLGRNKRSLSDKEKGVAILAFLFALAIIGTSTIIFTLLVLYLIKSALGIDLFEGHLGIWEWLNE